ncbi:hypothetical protein BDN70DRAFT_894614 [Pholiota conissans]|uniref:Uncharacterized protein n=1 Tax=Pholiota conissans TaxID=109636 RepID=A0A9P5Z2D2_9AGAR|nr:hypothetical protein BDN70DRAFT_894614 [Pholiota conissans]
MVPAVPRPASRSPLVVVFVAKWHSGRGAHKEQITTIPTAMCSLATLLSLLETDVLQTFTLLSLDSLIISSLWASLKEIIWDAHVDAPYFSEKEMNDIDRIGSKSLRIEERLRFTMFYPPIDKCRRTWITCARGVFITHSHGDVVVTAGKCAAKRLESHTTIVEGGGLRRPGGFNMPHRMCHAGDAAIWNLQQGASRRVVSVLLT